MKINNRTEYGVRALVLLAGRHEQGPLAISKIAELESIPESFLEQILATLRRAGLVVAVRGANGGYQLARPPQEITLADAVQALEGSLSPIGCADDSTDPLAFCKRAEACRTRHVWVRMTASITEALRSLTLADVLEESEEAV